jgi:hypothetical protein
MKRYWRILALVSALAPLPGLSLAKKPLGEAADPDALLRVHSYCVDMANLEAAEAGDVRKFLEKQNQPKGLLGKLPWKLVENCAQADAVVSLKFDRSFRIAPAGGSALGTGTAALNSVPEPAYSAQMLVRDRASQKPLYKVKGEADTMGRIRSIGDPFSKLIRDLKTLSK